MASPSGSQGPPRSKHQNRDRGRRGHMVTCTPRKHRGTKAPPPPSSQPCPSCPCRPPAKPSWEARGEGPGGAEAPESRSREPGGSERGGQEAGGGPLPVASTLSVWAGKGPLLVQTSAGSLPAAWALRRVGEGARGPRGSWAGFWGMKGTFQGGLGKRGSRHEATEILHVWQAAGSAALLDCDIPAGGGEGGWRALGPQGPSPPVLITLPSGLCVCVRP